MENPPKKECKHVKYRLAPNDINSSEMKAKA